MQLYWSSWLIFCCIQIQICETSVEKGELEEQFWRSHVALSALDEDAKDNADRTIKKTLIKLFAVIELHTFTNSIYSIFRILNIHSMLVLEYILWQTVFFLCPGLIFTLDSKNWKKMYKIKAICTEVYRAQKLGNALCKTEKIIYIRRKKVSWSVFLYLL